MTVLMKKKDIQALNKRTRCELQSPDTFTKLSGSIDLPVCPERASPINLSQRET